MTGKELEKICREYPDFDFQFIFSDRDNGKFLNIRSFSKLEIADIGHSDKVVLLFIMVLLMF